jgi:hypothetical protein
MQRAAVWQHHVNLSGHNTSPLRQNNTIQINNHQSNTTIEPTNQPSANYLQRENNHPFYQDAHPTVKQLNSNNTE